MSHEPLIIGEVAMGEPVGMETLPDQVIGDFLQSAQDLVQRLRQREEEFSRIIQITERVNYGVVLEEVLDFLYDEMRQAIPYDRIGFSLIQSERNTAVARWARSDRPMLLSQGYESPLEGSTLQQVIDSGRPRIINDLPAYLANKPTSESTALIVREGMKSSLTCPLIVQGRPVGFIFFSSENKSTYSRVHVAFFQQIAGQVAAIVEKSRLYTTLAEQNVRIEEQNAIMLRELEMAQKVQQAMIPQTAPSLDGLDVAFEYAPAIQVGGDILDILPQPDGSVLFFMGDAVGHGVQAALVVSVLKTALQSTVQADPDPKKVLAGINKVMDDVFGEQFVTAACCLWHPDGAVDLSLAGHPRPLWYQNASGEVIERGESGLPLGIDSAVKYQSVRLDIQPGDCLVLYTDGISEAFDPSGNIYGTQRLTQLLGLHARLGAQDMLDRIKADLFEHCSGSPLKDDLTVLIIKRR